MGEIALKTTRPGARAWYGTKEPPSEETLAAIEAVDPEPQLLYELGHEGEAEYDGIVKRIYDRMDSLKRNPLEFRNWTEEDGIGTFFEVMLDFAPLELKSRVQLLQRLGSFKFRKADGPEEMRAKISAVFAQPQDDEGFSAQLSTQARRLGAIWSPKPDTLLDYIVRHLAQVGRVLSDRLNPAHEKPLRLIGHPFTEVRSTLLQPVVDSKVVAYERDAEIHLVTPVQLMLEKWDEDAMATGSGEQFNLLDALLLHELVELVLDETEPDLSSLDSHIVASTFERYLKGQMLQVAVEDFFLDWPPLSSEEIAERRQSEMAQQLEEINHFLGEDEIPEDDEEDLGDLPLDTAVPKRKVKAKKKVVRTKDGKKVVRTKDGKKVVRTKDGKKVVAKSSSKKK